MMRNYIHPHWPVSSHIKAVSTTRHDGFSTGSYSSFNLATHVDDDLQHVMHNREKLQHDLDLINEPLWMKQVHGNTIINNDTYRPYIEADGCYTTKKHLPCVIATADCLPILLTNKQGNFVMALHGGWRGLATGIINKGVEIAKNYGSNIFAWLGPAICKTCYEVGSEVKEKFIMLDAKTATAFSPSSYGRWWMDMYAVASQQLQTCGVNQIFSESLCTYHHPDKFFSYRRDGTTGRMVSLIWLSD